jgi:large subunit ribosomal protein L4
VNVNLYLESRNIHNVDVIDAQVVNPLCLVAFDKVIVTVEALKKIEESLA